MARAETVEAPPFTEGPAYRDGYLYFTDEDSVTNCTFAGKDLKTLYITAGASLWEASPERLRSALALERKLHGDGGDDRDGLRVRLFGLILIY